MTKPVALTYENIVVNKTGQGYCLLDSSIWLDAIVRAHQEVRDVLKQNEKHFLLAKPPEYFKKLLNGEGGTIIAAFNNAGVLAGFCAGLNKANWVQAKEEKALTFPDLNGVMAELCGDRPVSIIQSFCVRPREQGQTYSQGILDAAFVWHSGEVCASTGGHLFAQVALDNRCSWTKFMRHDYVMEAVWAEQVDGVMRDKVLLRHASKDERKAILSQSVFEIDAKATDLAGPKALLRNFKTHLQNGQRIMLAPSVRGPRPSLFVCAPV